MPHKYLMTDGDFDNFPPQMFTEASMDTVENYYTVSNQILAKHYPNALAVVKEAGWRMPQIFLRDLWLSVMTIASYLSFMLVGLIFLPKKSWWKYVALGLGLHLLGVTAFASLNYRYLLLEIIVLFAVGAYGLLSNVRSKLVFAVVLIAMFAIDVTSTSRQFVKEMNRTSSIIDYRQYGDYFSKIVNGRPKVLSVRSQVAFVNNWDWQPWPKQLHDLHKYCLRYGVGFIYYGGFEIMTRKEWIGKLGDMDLARPEFIAILKNQYGTLYAVNANPANTTR